MSFKYSFLTFCLFVSLNTWSQCTITSSNGWTAEIDITPTAAIPEFVDCPWYYHYEVQFDYTVTFTGSTNNRSVSANLYFNCSGGTGGQPYVFLGTFTSDASGTLTTGNNARQYNAVSAYNYGANPSCTEVTVADIGCSTVQLSYWGNAVSGSSTTCGTGTTLPISLLSFNAKAKQQQVLIDWATATETNNDFFTVERSYDGKEWETVTVVKGAGTSDQLLHYSFTDRSAKNNAYYRLKQTDFDGQFSYSKSVFVRFDAENNISEIMAYPNPANDEVIISGLNVGQAKLTLLNSLGQTMSPDLYQTGTNRLNTSVLPEGMYWLAINDDTQSTALSIVVKH